MEGPVSLLLDLHTQRLVVRTPLWIQGELPAKSVVTIMSGCTQRNQNLEQDGARFFLALYLYACSSVSMHLWKLALSVLPHHMTWSSFLQKGCFFSLKRRNSIPDAYNFPPGISLLKDCNDFHQAKDGDGWVEQSSQPFFFGLLQKVCNIIHFGESLFSNFTISVLLSFS